MARSQLIGITKSIAGIISATGKFRILHMRKPVASMMNPPQALKSLIIAGVRQRLLRLAN